MERIVHWRGLEEWRAEAASIELTEAGMRAAGVQLGLAPAPYRLRYELDASEGFITRRLEVEAVGEGWRRTVTLDRDGGGAWSCEATADGDAELAEPGGDVASFGGALDCDLGFSPLTNLMPVRRSDLDRRPGHADFLMAWVSVPDLEVLASTQRYEHVQIDPEGPLVRYVDRGRFRGFTGRAQAGR